MYPQRASFTTPVYSLPSIGNPGWLSSEKDQRKCRIYLRNSIIRESGSKITTEERGEAVRRRKVHNDWVHENVMGDGSTTIMAMPYGNPEPTYRDEARAA
ncbi:amidase [Penicillium lividum]|nr:amidase [Penicillium lividum]